MLLSTSLLFLFLFLLSLFPYGGVRLSDFFQNVPLLLGYSRGALDKQIYKFSSNLSVIGFNRMNIALLTNLDA
jgi:hypothetical protein